MKKVQEITFRCPRIEVLDSRVESPLASLSNSLHCRLVPATSKVPGLKRVEVLSETKGPPLLAPAPLLPIAGSPLVLVPPQQRLQLLWDEHGARTALEMMLSIALPPAVPDALAEQIVEHFVNDKLLLPWELTSWWKPRYVSLPTAVLDDAVARRPEPLVPDAAGGERPTWPYEWDNQSLPKSVRLPPGLPTSPLELPEPLWAAEDLKALTAVAEYLKKHDTALYVKYRPYFEPHAGVGGEFPPILLGVIGAKHMKTGNPFNFSLELVQALGELEQWWTEYESWTQEFPADALENALAYFSDFDDVGTSSPISEETILRIWTRRICISLWSDANGHWPWTLQKSPIELRRALLGWSPQPMQSEKVKGDVLYPASFKSNIAPFLVGFDGRNAQWLFTQSGGYSTGNVWSPDPFYEWLIAYFQVKPLIDKMPGKGQETAVYATSQWLLNRAYVHDDAFPKKDAANPNPFPGSTTSKRLLEDNFGGCWLTGPLFAAILRAMNVPCVFTNAPILGREVDLSVDPPIHAIRKGGETGHTSMVCRLVEGALAVFHADFVCAFKGQRCGDPSMLWIPYPEWLIVQFFLDTTADTDSVHAEITNMLTGHWHAVAVKQMKGMGDSGKIEDFLIDDVYYGRTYWLERIIRVLQGEDQLGHSPGWLKIVQDSDLENNTVLRDLAVKLLTLGDKMDASSIPKCLRPGNQPLIPSQSGAAFGLLPLEWTYTYEDEEGEHQRSVSDVAEVLAAIAAIASWVEGKLE